MTDNTLFIVDDEKTIRDGIKAFFEDEYRIFAFESAETGLEALQVHHPDLVLLDIGLPGMNGIDALKHIRAVRPEVLVVMITAYEDITSVIACMKLGAYDYIVKPLHMEGLGVTIANALETLRLRKEIKSLQENQLRDQAPFFIGESQVIHDILTYIEKVAKSPDTPVLIQGETGTGKELMASTIHHRSPNFAGPLITVNCAAIPGELIESELFGYEKGAFSGASATGKKGLIEMADKGTLFLDEIGDLSLDAQAKLLRFMEQGEFYKLGGTRRKKVFTRVVSATNKDLEKMVETDQFREDLYYRISVVKIQVPSLSQRPEDLKLFADYFLKRFNQKFDRNLMGISPSAWALMETHPWKGNVREMKNMMERGVLTAEGPELTPGDLGLDGRASREAERHQSLLPLKPLTRAGVDLSAIRFRLDAFYFTQAMKLADGNESRAARLLNLKHHVFRYQYKQFLAQQENT
ncbi:MAG: sigma-54 dependent transcriptional regulator [Desulfotignum sp.]|nr:sigma-54 dependent transcriptional regulator [Desulfotignum sp.]MCF8139178.1 sigma-54 dependent transcriptional regulator [Desulfotignum sp.]